MLGIDLVEDSRIERLSAAERERVFSPEELATGKLASVFALKEAASKATGASIDEVRVSYAAGVPRVRVAGFELECSVSHEAGLTVAIVTGRGARSRA